jgi:hypothetical protein
MFDLLQGDIIFKLVFFSVKFFQREVLITVMAHLGHLFLCNYFPLSLMSFITSLLQCHLLIL